MVQEVEARVNNSSAGPIMYHYLVTPTTQRGGSIAKLAPAYFAADSITHLQTSFAVVGLLEHYHVFVELVAATLDPTRLQDKLWINAESKQLNVHEGTFVSGTSNLLQLLSNASINKLRQITAVEQEVYDAGCRVTAAQCSSVIAHGSRTVSRLRPADCDEVRRRCPR